MLDDIENLSHDHPVLVRVSCYGGMVGGFIGFAFALSFKNPPGYVIVCCVGAGAIATTVICLVLLGLYCLGQRSARFARRQLDLAQQIQAGKLLADDDPRPEAGALSEPEPAGGALSDSGQRSSQKSYH